MVNYTYLQMGLCAMARAHLVNSMSGHLGAAVVAGYFIAEQHPELDGRVYMGIEAELDRIIRGESVFSPDQNAGISTSQMFEPFPKELPRDNLIDSIADALKQNIDQTRQSGHNVIFASIAIRALKDHVELATPSVVEGIRELTAGFNGASPGGGYYGKQKGRINGWDVDLPDDISFPPYPNLEIMADTVLDEVIGNASKHRQGFGGLWHVINHAAALLELAKYDYTEIALMGLPAHYQHVRLLRTLPDVADELGPVIPAEYDPFTSEYWLSEKLRRDSALLTHRIKTMYGFEVVLDLEEEMQTRKLCAENFRYLM